MVAIPFGLHIFGECSRELRAPQRAIHDAGVRVLFDFVHGAPNGKRAGCMSPALVVLSVLSVGGDFLGLLGLEVCLATFTPNREQVRHLRVRPV